MVGRRAINLRYMIWAERDFEGSMELAVEPGRVFRIEGAEAEAVWKVIGNFVDPKTRRLTVVHGKPALRPE